MCIKNIEKQIMKKRKVKEIKKSFQKIDKKVNVIATRLGLHFVIGATSWSMN